MSIYKIVENNFLIKMTVIDLIDSFLSRYLVLIDNKRSTDSIDLHIKNWTASTAENNPDELNNKAMLAWFKLEDGMFDDLTSFNIIYFDTYIKYKGLRLLQKLINEYAVDSNIVKNALLNLIETEYLYSRISCTKTLSLHSLPFIKKMDNIGKFFQSHACKIIYREIYIAYLMEQRDKHPLSCPRLYSTANSANAVVKGSPVDLLSNDFPNVFLNPYITSINDINDIRTLNKKLFKHYNAETMKKIALHNLKDIVTKFFMISPDELTKALLSCSAILGGSIVAQSFYGTAETVFKTSDANFYVPVKSDSTVLQDLILSSGYELYTTDLPLTILFDADNIDVDYLNSYFHTDTVSDIYSSSILLIDKYKNNFGKKIQVIKVQSPADVKTTFEFGQFVVSHYDLTFLQNFFDGNNLYINDFHGIVQKKGSVTALIKDACTVNVSTTKSPKLLRKWYCSITATTIRCLKYQQRGFQIDGVPELSLVTELGIL
jgi:hypothetical protein